MEKKNYRKHHDKHGKRHIDGKYASSDGNIDTKAEEFIARKKFELSKDESDNNDHPSMHIMKAERYVTPLQHGYYQNFDKASHGYAGTIHRFDTSTHGYGSHSHDLDKSTHGYACHDHKLDEFPRSYPGYDQKSDTVTRSYAKHSHSFEKKSRVRTVYDHNFDKMTHGFAGSDHNLENSMHGYAGYDHNSENYMHGYTNSDLFDKVKHGREGYNGHYQSNHQNGKEGHHDFWNGGNDYYAHGGNRTIFPSSSQVERHVSRLFKRFEAMTFNRGF